MLCATIFSSSPTPSFAWGNGGRTKDLAHPKYGTHDWIAEQGMFLLPLEERVLLEQYKAVYLLGTEAPDNQEVARRFFASRGLDASLADCYGNPFWHNNYYYLNGELLEGCDSASRMAQLEFEKAVRAYLRGQKELATFYLGTAGHYTDVCAWPHVMGAESLHQEGESSSKHAEFERSVGETIILDVGTGMHTSTLFQRFIIPLESEELAETTTAYDAIMIAGRITSEGVYYSAAQMQQYLPMGRRQNGSWIDADNWNPTFVAETGEALNRAAHAVAQILHLFYAATQGPATPASEGTLQTKTSAAPTLQTLIVEHAGDSKRDIEKSVPTKALAKDED